MKRQQSIFLIIKPHRGHGICSQQWWVRSDEECGRRNLRGSREEAAGAQRGLTATGEVAGDVRGRHILSSCASAPASS